MKSHPLRALVLSTLSGSFVLASCGGGGGGGGTPPPVDPVLSSFTVTPAFGTNADGLGAVEARVVLADAAGNPLPGRTVVLEVGGFANTLVQPPRSDGTGAASGLLRTTVGEKKTLTAVIDPGPGEVRMGPITAEFLRIQANWRFVRASGSDANDGRSPLTAWATPARALAELAPGDVLFIGAGTYSDSLLITTAATADAPLEIRGDRTGEFTGDAGEVLFDLGGAALGIELRGAAHVTLRGLSIRGSDGGGGPSGAIYATGARDCAILDCRLYENRRGLELEHSTDLVVEGNRISSNLGDGLRLTGTTRMRVLANLVYANGGDGLDLNSASSALSVQFNTFHRNAGDQLRETVAGSTGLIANNVLSEGTGRGLGLAPASVLATEANLAWLASGNDPESTFNADPMLLDPAGADGILGNIGAEDDDFRVALLSPTLDAGQVQARRVELALAGSLAALGSRPDSLRDGQEADLPAANLGFHHALPLDAFASLTPEGARLAFATTGDARVRTRAWERTSDAWDTARDTLALGSEVRWLVQRVSSGPKPEEIVAAQIDTGAGTQLVVRSWDARRWSDTSPAVLSTRIAAANADERGFDVEYEATSGEALLVYADGANNVLARSLVEGAWSAAAPVFAPALNTGTVLWTELVPRPGTNEVALVALDDQQRLAAAIWDGTQWTRPILLATQVNSVRDFKAFDAAWESLSGDLLVAWGYSQFAEETRYATLTRTTGIWTTGQFVSTDALGKSLALASDPTTDRIVGIFGEGNSDDDVGVSVWSGASWSNTAEMTLTGIAQSRAMEIGWLGNSGLAFALYRDQAQTGAFQWAFLNSGGWRRQTEVTLPGVGKLVRAETRIVPGTSRVLLLLLDDAGALWAIEHDGATWGLRNGGLPLATGLDPANPGFAFDFDLRAH
jgi:parallel beta-helix repeat protein